MNFVKWRGSSTAKLTANYEAMKQFNIDVNAVVEMEDTPPQLVFNWDQTGINIVPGSSWTMKAKGSKWVEIVGMGDKRQITATFRGALSGGFLPPQLIYQGLSSSSPISNRLACDIHANLWSNEDKMVEYIESIFVPYVEGKHKDLKFSSDQPVLVIFDVIKGQQTESVLKFLEEKTFLWVCELTVPTVCSPWISVSTDR